MMKKQDKVQGSGTELANEIAKGTEITGNIDTFGNIRVDGKVFGNLKTKSKAVFGTSSFLRGNIVAQNAEIEGEVDGKVMVAEVLVLKSTAIIKGDIVTNKLIVESGATFNGGCQMGESIGEIKLGSSETAKLNGRPEGKSLASAN